MTMTAPYDHAFESKWTFLALSAVLLLCGCGGNSSEAPVTGYAAVSFRQQGMNFGGVPIKFEQFVSQVRQSGLTIKAAACGWEYQGNTTAICGVGQQYLYLLRIPGAEVQQARQAGWSIAPDFELPVPPNSNSFDMAPGFIMFDCSPLAVAG